MTILGHTKGGYPIYMGGGYSHRSSKSNKNPRYRCKNCGHSTTKNQLKIASGKCRNCNNQMAEEMTVYMIDGNYICKKS